MTVDALCWPRSQQIAEGTRRVTTRSYLPRTLDLWKRRNVARHLVSRRGEPSPEMPLGAQRSSEPSPVRINVRGGSRP